MAANTHLGFGVLGTPVGPVMDWCRWGWLGGCAARASLSQDPMLSSVCFKLAVAVLNTL